MIDGLQSGKEDHNNFMKKILTGLMIITFIHVVLLMFADTQGTYINKYEIRQLNRQVSYLNYNQEFINEWKKSNANTIEPILKGFIDDVIDNNRDELYIGVSIDNFLTLCNEFLGAEEYHTVIVKILQSSTIDAFSKNLALRHVANNYQVYSTEDKEMLYDIALNLGSVDPRLDFYGLQDLNYYTSMSMITEGNMKASYEELQNEFLNHSLDSILFDIEYYESIQNYYLTTLANQDIYYVYHASDIEYKLYRDTPEDLKVELIEIIKAEGYSDMRLRLFDELWHKSVIQGTYDASIAYQRLMDVYLTELYESDPMKFYDNVEEVFSNPYFSDKNRLDAIYALNYLLYNEGEYDKQVISWYLGNLEQFELSREDNVSLLDLAILGSRAKFAKIINEGNRAELEANYEVYLSKYFSGYKRISTDEINRYRYHGEKTW